ncbi:hypothetical protein [Microbispora sp. ATCC PTA-5024]|uniref:hypothetical protein n=1 Tax=Microbispora sp. ATCC PTA-5024 TaxID=316330 RepID=UPI0003DCC6A0|nr:hypothetical protein [Microbispora sp. ATCC PTA-5024]ETK37376.1 hypothetical protein MPTA5024_04180 [Microbispora sp. ATCC PTA-5024]
MAADATTWNSLEIAKLTVEALVPVSLAVMGFLFTRATNRLEASQWLNQKLIEKRVELLGTALPRLNDLYCYFAWVGGWKELSPPEVIGLKRELDRLFFANRAFFSDSVQTDYEAFSRALFKTYAAPGVDAQLRTSLTSHDGDRAHSYPKTWQAEWTALFADADDRTNLGLVRERYEALVRRLGAEVNPGGGGGR